MSRSLARSALAVLAAVLAIACSDDSNNDPAPVPRQRWTPSPSPAPTTAHPGGTMTMGFNGTMMAGMEQYVDLHQVTRPARWLP
jgi:hypothetical protein